MKSNMRSHQRKYILFFACTISGLLLFSFQNCGRIKVADKVVDSPTKILATDPTPTPTPTTPVITANKNCDSAAKNDGDLWWVENGLSRDSQICAEGIGTQYIVYQEEQQLQCQNGSIVATGLTNRKANGNIEGLCNMDCGDHKDGDQYWSLLSNTTETKACATSLSVTSQVEVRNEQELICKKSILQSTGNTRKVVLSESACPPLAFNDIDQTATIAYEDTYIPANGTTAASADHDYNDFVANIKVLETYNSIGQLSKISIEYIPVKKLSGLDSELILVFDGQVRGRGGFKSNVADYKTEPMFQGDAKITYELRTSDGTDPAGSPNPIKTISKNQDLIVYSSTKEALAQKQHAIITITEIDGTMNMLKDRKGLSVKRYRSLLHVKNKQGYDVDLSDINPTMFDNKSFPLAFFVPVNWKAPKESMNIVEPYPQFAGHAKYLMTRQPLENEPAETAKWFDQLLRPQFVE